MAVKRVRPDGMSLKTAILAWFAAVLADFRDELNYQAAKRMSHGLLGSIKWQAKHRAPQKTRDWGDGPVAKVGQSVDVVGVMLTIVVAAVVGYVGLVVMSDTEDTTSFTSNSAFDNASTNLTSGVETSFSLIEVVFITLMLALIIGTLVGLRRR